MSTLYNMFMKPFQTVVRVFDAVTGYVYTPPIMISSDCQCDIESPQTTISVESPVNDALQQKLYNFRPRKPVTYTH